MNFLDELFTSDKKDSNDEKRLVDSVKKISNNEYGTFAKLMDDLGSYIDLVGENDNSMRKMAYAYARRYAAIGLCAQGFWGQEEFDYIFTIFQSFQQNTSLEMLQSKYVDTIQFQEEANLQAIELIESYDSRLNKNMLVLIVSIISKNPSIAKNNGIIYTVDELLDKLKEFVR